MTVVEKQGDAAPLVQAPRQHVFFALSPLKKKKKKVSMQSNKFQYRESLTQTRLASSKQLLLERRQLEFKVGEVSEV